MEALTQEQVEVAHYNDPDVDSADIEGDDEGFDWDAEGLVDISDNGLSLIAGFEGFVGHVYYDAVGVPTIGYGHKLLPGEAYPGGLTENQARAVLHIDTHKCVEMLNDKVKVEVTQNSFDALASLAFNAGCAAIGQSTLMKLLNAGCFGEAAHEFTRWCHGGGKVLPALAHRRAVEMELFLRPDGITGI